MLILLVGPLTIACTPTDIFPNIDIPVVTVVWNYGGLSADEMSNRIVSIYERNLTATVNDIEHVESQSLRGIAVTEGSLSDPQLPAGLFPTATQLHRQRILKDEIMWS